MTRYVKKEYEVLEGVVELFPDPVVSSYNPRPPHSSVIVLPDRSGNSGMPNMPEPRDRYAAIRACHAAGIQKGVEVIRVKHINEYYIDNEIFIGVVERFLFHMMPGQTKWMPILVRFKVGNTGYQDIPFSLMEIETLENAKKQLCLDKKDPKKVIDTLQDGVIRDLLRERNGVIPFRDPKTFYH